MTVSRIRSVAERESMLAEEVFFWVVTARWRGRKGIEGGI
jgi:hypothetical protein